MQIRQMPSHKKYFVNPYTGRKCLNGGVTHRKLLAAQGGQAGKGIPAMLAGLIAKPILGALFGKAKPTLRKAAKAAGLDYLLKPLIGRGYGKGAILSSGGALKLSGQGPRRRRRKAPRRRRPMRGGRKMHVMPYPYPMRKPHRRAVAPKFAFL